MKRLSKLIEAVKLGAQPDFKNPLNGQFVVLPLYETEQVFGLGASSSSLTAFVNDSVSGQYVVGGVTANFGTTSSSGTAQVEVATGTQAVGSGTNQLQAALSLSGTANTPVNGTVVASPQTIKAGDRVNVILGGTLTGLANGCVNIVLQRVA